ncbi:MAG: Rne/Rng family ribonuclease [Gaiellaceae bacterium]
MRWFRIGKKQDESAAASGEVREETPPEAKAVEAPPAPAAEEATGQPKKRRRRGSRGGRGRKKPGAAAAEADGDPSTGGKAEKEESAGKAAKAEKPKEAGTSRGRPERKPERKTSRAGRKRAPTKRAPLPTAKRELVISVDVGEQRVAILEDDRVAEVYLERPERRSIAGNIYLGVVDNVLPGMEAAFVEIGLEKNGFLYVDEIVGPELEGRKGARKIQDLIKRGETILVQAVKDPMKSKGARLTTEISLPGRYLVFVPSGEGSGVSRRLEDDERTRLKDILKGLDAKGGGIIVRTAAEGASAEDIERDLVFLQRLWKNIQAKAKTASAPSLVYEEAELPLRIVRDLFAGDFVGAQIDDDRTFRRIVSYLKKTSPHMIERVHRYREKEPLFETFGVEKEITSTLDRRVDLPSGGYLIFDYAEAFTVIDVNTGRFVGSRAKGSSGRLEDTIVKNNLEAVSEVVRQLRLRDIGGIIVIDFIDMANPKNRQTVEEALRTELERDRTKTYVVEISPLGLVEMTRQNVTEGPREILTVKCATCAGDGFVVSDATHALEVERKLKTVAKGSRVQAFRVAVHPRVLPILVGAGGARLDALEKATRRRFYLVPMTAHGHVHLDHFEVLEQGKVEALRPESPIEEGAPLELKLVEVGLYDATAAVGKVDGAEVVVAGAAKLVGKKVKVHVGRVLDGVAFAMLEDAAAQPTPVTFEAEAEKPTRAPSRKKDVAAKDDAEGVSEAEVALSTDDASEPELELEEPEPLAEIAAADEGGDTETAADGTPKPKKRTRRGSRGGKGRKKPTADAAVGEPAPEPAKTTGRKPAPRIHVPSSEPASDTAAAAVDVEPEDLAPSESAAESADDATNGTPKKKRTRRGTRGGRRRKKPVANADAPSELAVESDVEAVAEGVEAAAETEGLEDAGVPEYVPMSEWIEDFDARAERAR